MSERRPLALTLRALGMAAGTMADRRARRQLQPVVKWRAADTAAGDG